MFNFPHTDFQTDLAFLNKPDLSSGSSMGRGRSVSGPEGPVTRGQGSRGHDLGSSRSRMHSEPDKRPDQMDRLAGGWMMAKFQSPLFTIDGLSIIRMKQGTLTLPEHLIS